MQIEVLQAGLRKRIVNVVKLSAEYRFDEAIKLAEEYMNRLKIIRSLRCANYSLSAILRMLNKLEKKQYNKSEKDMLDMLNTPDEDEIDICGL